MWRIFWSTDMEMEEKTGRKLYTKGEVLFIMVVGVVGHYTRRRVLVGKQIHKTWDQAVKEKYRYPQLPRA